MTTGAALATESTTKTANHVLKHYPIEAKGGFQTVQLPKGATIHGIGHENGKSHLITSHMPDMLDMEHRLLNLVMHNGEVPETSNYLGRTSADPEDPMAALLHVFDCGSHPDAL